MENGKVFNIFSVIEQSVYSFMLPSFKLQTNIVLMNVLNQGVHCA